MEMCPSCGKSYLMYDFHKKSAVCTNRFLPCKYEQSIERFEYLKKYGNIMNPVERDTGDEITIEKLVAAACK